MRRCAAWASSAWRCAGPAILRALTAADVEPIVRACADPEIIRFIPAMPAPCTPDDAMRFLKLAEQLWEAGGALFAVADAGTGEWLGNIDLKALDPRGNGEIGYLIAPWARGRGVATAVTTALARWAFAQGVRRVEVLAAAENLASQRVALAAGFRREGVRRSAEDRRDGTRRRPGGLRQALRRPR